MRILLPFFVIFSVFCKEYDELPSKCQIKSQQFGAYKFPEELICVGLEDEELKDILENNFKDTEWDGIGKITIKHSPELKTLDLTSLSEKNMKPYEFNIQNCPELQKLKNPDEGFQLAIKPLSYHSWTMIRLSITETRLDDFDEILQLLPCRNESAQSTSEINYLSLKFKNNDFKGDLCEPIADILEERNITMMALEISKNPKLKIEADCFKDLVEKTDVRYLDLTHQEIESLDDFGDSLGKVGRLELSNNKIQKLSKNVFFNNSKVDLRNNLITEIEKEEAFGLNTKEIFLNNNKLTTFSQKVFPYPHIPDDETTVYLYDNQLNCNCEMYDVHNFYNNELSIQYQLEGQIPLKLKFRCYNPVSMHLKTSSEFFKNSNQQIQDTCNEHAQLCENYHPEDCPKSHFGGAIFLTIFFTALATVGITYFTRQFIARRRLTEFPSLELDEDEDTEYIDN